MPKLYDVRRRYTGDRVYEAGEVVDGTNWRNAEKLVAQGYLARRPDPMDPVDGNGRGGRGRRAGRLDTPPSGPTGPEGDPDA